MKKNKLIELLQNIKGNPDIYLWNGYVSDFVDIEKELVEMILVKTSKDWLKRHITFEYVRDADKFQGVAMEDRFLNLSEEDHLHIDQITETTYKRYHSGWEERNPNVSTEDFSDWYSAKKKAYILNAKIKGKRIFDRLGNMDY